MCATPSRSTASVPLDSDNQTAAAPAIHERLSDDGLRVLAVAYRGLEPATPTRATTSHSWSWPAS